MLFIFHLNPPLNGKMTSMFTTLFSTGRPNSFYCSSLYYTSQILCFFFNKLKVTLCYQMVVSIFLTIYTFL